MRDKVICTILMLLIDLIALMLIGVCNQYTVPQIAIGITVTLTCIASGATYRMLKYGILKLYESWNLKRKQ